jgi:hypothetical protein
MKPANKMQNWRIHASFVYTFPDLSGILLKVRDAIDD